MYVPIFAFYDHEGGEPARAFMIEPEVVVDGANARVTLDGRAATPLRARTDKTTEQLEATFGLVRETAYGGSYWIPGLSHTNGLSGSRRGIRAGLRVTPTEPVTVGSLRAVFGFNLAQPLVTMEVTGRDRATFYPTYADWAYGYVFTQPKLDTRHRPVDLVDVGAGTETDLAGVDPRGKLALVTTSFRDRDGLIFVNNSTAQPLLTRLRDAGALAVVAALDEGRPDWCATGGCQSAQTRQTPLPVLTVGPGEGERLRDLLTDGPRRVRLSARESAGYDYQIRTNPTDRIPEGTTIDIDQRSLASEVTRYHSDEPGYTFNLLQAVEIGRAHV